MKVKDLMKVLEKFNQEAHIHIQTDVRFEEDIMGIYEYESESVDVVVLTNRNIINA